MGEGCVLDTPSKNEKIIDVITFNLIHLSVNSLTNKEGSLRAMISARQGQFGPKYDFEKTKCKTSLSQCRPIILLFVMNEIVSQKNILLTHFC